MTSKSILRRLSAQTGYQPLTQPTGQGMLAFDLPWPPSGNASFRITRSGGRYTSKEVKAYRDEVFVIWKRLKATKRAGRLSVHITAYPPDKRPRDLDNIAKTTLDAMQHAGVYDNDSQIDVLLVRRGLLVKNGLLQVVIYPLEK